MTRRIATTAAMMAALLLLPASAHAAESVSVDAGVLTYLAGDGTVDDVWVSASDGLHYLTEPTSPSGTVGAGCTYIGSATSECTGATRAVVDLLDGDDSATVVALLPATLLGRGGADVLVGGPLADTIDGGPGVDRVYGGAGDDKIEARDGEADKINCGPGDDPVFADPQDVLTDCEPPPPPPGEPEAPVEPPADAPVPPQLPGDAGALPPLALLPVAIEQKVFKVDANGVATFDLACAPWESAGCAGTVYLDPVGRGKKGRARALAARRGRYGRSRFNVAAGRKTRLRMSLSAAARRKLGLSARKARAARRGRRVTAKVTVKQRGRKPVKSRVKLKT